MVKVHICNPFVSTLCFNRCRHFEELSQIKWGVQSIERYKYHFLLIRRRNSQNSEFQVDYDRGLNFK